MISELAQFLGKLTLYAWCLIVSPVILAGLILVARKRVKNVIVKWVLYFVLVLAIFRIVIFYNPISWAVYKTFLPLEKIDWRHYDAIVCENIKYLKPQKNLKYLAVGSSQTAVIYNKYVREHKELGLFSLAGLSTLDLYNYRNEIIREKPKFLLLYLSEFDLANETEVLSSKWSPYTLSDISELRSVMDTTSYYTEEDKQIIYDVFFGKFFPEFKYSFVFKDLTNIFLDKDKLLDITPPTQVSDSISLKIQIKSLQTLSEKYIPFNMFYLRKAIDYFNHAGIRVVIVEGQYNPLAYNDNNLRINKKVDILLKDLTAKNSANMYISRENLPVLLKEDYRDGYHVNEKAGYQFAQFIVGYLDSKSF